MKSSEHKLSNDQVIPSTHGIKTRSVVIQVPFVKNDWFKPLFFSTRQFPSTNFLQSFRPVSAGIPANSSDRPEDFQAEIIESGSWRITKKNTKQQLDKLYLFIILLSGTMPPLLGLAQGKHMTVRVFTTDQKLWLVVLRDELDLHKNVKISLVEICCPARLLVIGCN